MESKKKLCQIPSLIGRVGLLSQLLESSYTRLLEKPIPPNQTVGQIVAIQDLPNNPTIGVLVFAVPACLAQFSRGSTYRENLPSFSKVAVTVLQMGSGGNPLHSRKYYLVFVSRRGIEWSY